MSNPISRRDWFRLKPQSPVGQELGPPSRLERLAEPPNHDGMDLAQLPPVHEARLDSSEIAALFDDIRKFATDVTLLARQTGARTADTHSALELARDAFLSGKISKLQIRYSWQESQWIDTLDHRDDGIRLVRIQHTRT